MHWTPASPASIVNPPQAIIKFANPPQTPRTSAHLVSKQAFPRLRTVFSIDVARPPKRTPVQGSQPLLFAYVELFWSSGQATDMYCSYQISRQAIESLQGS